MTDKDFQTALRELRLGNVPESMPYVVEYVADTSKERNCFMVALIECVERQNNTNRVLREMNEKLKTMNEGLRKAIAELTQKEVNANV